MDWKFSFEDLLWNAEQIVGKLPVKSLGDKQIYGDWYEVAEANGKKYLFEISDDDETNQRLNYELALINRYLPEKGKKFVVQSIDDTLEFTVVDFPYSLPSEKKFFILYFITAKNPETLKNAVLTLVGNRYYASKVNTGESLISVIDREIVDLTGSNIYDLFDVQENYDTAFDMHGKELPRTALYLDVPYFEIKSRKLKYPMEWHNPEE